MLESVYEEAMCIELALREIPFTRQPEIAIDYKGCSVGQGRLDLLVGGRLVVELKAVEMLAPIHSAQMISLPEDHQTESWLVNKFQCRKAKGWDQEGCFILKILGALGDLGVNAKAVLAAVKNLHWTHRPGPTR